MRKALIVAAAAAIAVSGTLSEPTHAGDRGGAVAAGVLGGLAVGAIVGAAASQPRYYGPPPAYGAEPAPVYVAPPPPRSAYDPGPSYYEAYPRTYYREYYPTTETGWYDRWGRWHPSRAY